MPSGAQDPVRFSAWLARPQSLIALAAVLLSVCGLFVALYETALMRQAQQASVWPYVEVVGSLTAQQVELRVSNHGVGPARIQTAQITRDGAPIRDWKHLLDELGAPAGSMDYYYSLISGRVLPRDSTPEVILRLEAASGSAAPKLAETLSTEIIEGRINVTLCYCSVYDQCWISSLSDVLDRTRSTSHATGAREVDGCGQEQASSI